MDDVQSLFKDPGRLSIYLLFSWVVVSALAVGLNALGSGLSEFARKAVFGVTIPLLLLLMPLTGALAISLLGWLISSGS